MRIKKKQRKIWHFIIVLLLMIMLPVLILCTVGIRKNSREIQERNLEYWRLIAQDITHDLDKEIEGYDKLSMSALIQDRLLDILSQEEFDYYEYIEASRWMEDQLRVELYLNESLFSSFQVLGNNGFYYSSDNEISFAEAENMTKEIGKDGRITLFIPYSSDGERRNNCITVARYINSYKNLSPLGYFMIHLKTTHLDDIWEDKELTDIQILVLDREGELIYGKTEGEKTKDLLPFMEEDSGDFYGKTDSNLYVYQKSEYTGWIAVLAIPRLLYQEPLWRMAGLFLIAGGITVLLTVALAYLLMHWVYLAELESKKRELEKNRAELKALQTQINPHFLYNTLGAINMYSVCEDSMAIQDITDALSKMFRYAVQSPMEPVKITEEIGHVENYLKIQRYRLGVLPDITIDVEGVKQAWMLRLTLQPIVENIFKHAFSEGILPGHEIKICAREEENCLVVDVSDNGRGPSMDIDPMEFIPDGEKAGRGTGLSNVHRRLQLAYGREYGLVISGKRGEGMTVQIRQPYIYQTVKN